MSCHVDPNDDTPDVCPACGGTGTFPTLGEGGQLWALVHRVDGELLGGNECDVAVWLSRERAVEYLGLVDDGLADDFEPTRVA